MTGCIDGSALHKPDRCMGSAATQLKCLTTAEDMSHVTQGAITWSWCAILVSSLDAVAAWAPAAACAGARARHRP